MSDWPGTTDRSVAAMPAGNFPVAPELNVAFATISKLEGQTCPILRQHAMLDDRPAIETAYLACVGVSYCFTTPE